MFVLEIQKKSVIWFTYFYTPFLRTFPVIALSLAAIQLQSPIKTNALRIYF